MVLGAANVSGRRKGTFTFGGIAMAAGTTQIFLMGNELDVGYSPATQIRLTRVTMQGDVTTLDSGETFDCTVFKNAEATAATTGPVLLVQLSTTSAAEVAGNSTTIIVAGKDIIETTDDIIITLENSAATSVEGNVCVQVDYEYAD